MCPRQPKDTHDAQRADGRGLGVSYVLARNDFRSTTTDRFTFDLSDLRRKPRTRALQDASVSYRELW